MHPYTSAGERAAIIAASTCQAHLMLYAILIAFTLAALLAAIVLFITKRPATQRARVSRALTADNAPKYLQRRRAA